MRFSVFCTVHGWVSSAVWIIYSHRDWGSTRNQSSASALSYADSPMFEALRELVDHHSPSSPEPSLQSPPSDFQIQSHLSKGFCDFWGRMMASWCCGWEFLRPGNAVEMRREHISDFTAAWRSREEAWSCGFARFCGEQRYCWAMGRGTVGRRGRIACLKYNYFWSMK
jgi:hypothetical protein